MIAAEPQVSRPVHVWGPGPAYTTRPAYPPNQGFPMRKPARISLLTALLGVLGGGLWICHIPAQAADAASITGLGDPCSDPQLLCMEKAFQVNATAVAPD